LENIAREVLEQRQDIIRQYVRHRHGVYALYRRDEIYYVGLASNLRSRLAHHMKDRHQDSWDRFSVYVTIGDRHIREMESLIIRILKPPGNKQKGKFANSEDLRRRFRRDLNADYRVKMGDIFGIQHELRNSSRSEVRPPRPSQNGTRLEVIVRLAKDGRSEAQIAKVIGHDFGPLSQATAYIIGREWRRANNCLRQRKSAIKIEKSNKPEGKMALCRRMLTAGVEREKILKEFLKKFPGTKEKTARNSIAWVASDINCAKTAKDAKNLSMTGRTAFIRKLRFDGNNWTTAWEKVRAKYPGSSIGTCKKVWDKQERTPKADTSKKKILFCSLKGALGRGYRISDGFVVLKGSTAVLHERDSSEKWPKHMALRRQLIADGKLVETNGFYEFTSSFRFSAPSAAATVIHGGPANGLTAWRTQDGKKLKELDDLPSK
jgi:hypothetical protein